MDTTLIRCVALLRLASIADHLDNMGREREADAVTVTMHRLAQQASGKQNDVMTDDDVAGGYQLDFPSMQNSAAGINMGYQGNFGGLPGSSYLDGPGFEHGLVKPNNPYIGDPRYLNEAMAWDQQYANSPEFQQRMQGMSGFYQQQMQNLNDWLTQQRGYNPGLNEGYYAQMQQMQAQPAPQTNVPYSPGIQPQRYANDQQKLLVSKLKQVARGIEHCGDCGNCLYNPDSGVVYWNMADSDSSENGYTDEHEVKARFQKVPGVKRVELGNEGGSHRPGWITIQ